MIFYCNAMYNVNFKRCKTYFIDFSGSPFKRTMFKCFRFQLKKNKYEATLHTSSHKLMKKEDCREIEIPVPWGHIAGKCQLTLTRPIYLIYEIYKKCINTAIP